MRKDPSEKLPNFSEVEKHVFRQQKDGTIFIGKEKISKEMRDLLREQAKYLQTSQLWDVLNASTTDEAVDLALIQSANFEHVQFSKAMWHWSRFMRNIVTILAKE